MSRALTTDVLVVGGGPAGSAAAITLARGGAHVMVVDKACFPRDKCCGDGLTTGALRHLDDLGLTPDDVASWTTVDELSVVSPSGRLSQLPLTHGRGTFAAVARRIDLDAALLGLARDAGAEVLEERAFTSLVRRGDDLAVTLADGQTVHAEQVFAADGAWSPVRRSVEGERGRLPRSRHDRRPAARGRPAGDWHAFRTYASGVSPTAMSGLAVIFDEELLPGYAWSFPVGGDVANVGICVRRTPGTHGRELARTWERVLKSEKLAELLGAAVRYEEPVRTWPIPAGIDPGNLTTWDGRIFYVGDAARAADPFTGEGIAQALNTGAAAARALLGSAGGTPVLAARRYAEEVRTGLAREHRVASVLSTMMSSPFAARGAVAISGLHPLIARSVGRWMFEDFPRLVALEPENLAARHLQQTRCLPAARRPSRLNTACSA